MSRRAPARAGRPEPVGGVERWWPEGSCLTRARTLDQVIGDVLDQGRRPCILLAEDDPDLRELLVQTLRTEEYLVIEARDGCELMDAFAALLRTPFEYDLPDLMISDVRMPGWTGLEAATCLRHSMHAVPVILITAFADGRTTEAAARLERVQVLSKPFDMDELLRAVAGALGRASAS